MINLAAVPRDIKLGASLKDGVELFEEYEHVRRAQLESSLLMTHLATKHLHPDGYLVYSCPLQGFDPELFDSRELSRRTLRKKNQKLVPCDQRSSMLKQLIGGVQSKQALDLSIERTDEQLIWTSSTVNVMMGEDLID